MVKRFFMLVGVIFFSSLFSGCAVMNKARKADQLEKDLASCRSRLETVMEEKDDELERARKELMRTLGKELSEYKAKLEMTERGLVITFLAEIFFDSGKDAILADGRPVLSKVAEVLNKNVPNSNVAVEGHTDADPIKYSGWKSNWELSAARALAVLHYFIDNGGITPERLSISGYGQYRSVAPNDTAQNKRKNRRVEIIILPSMLTKTKAEVKI